MGDRNASPERHDLLALLSGLEVGTATIASDGFVGLVGRTGLSTRLDGPTELDTVGVWAVLSGDWIVAESVIACAGEGDGAVLAHAIRLFELEVNAAALAIARGFR